mgnify:CR=1 FL=1
MKSGFTNLGEIGEWGSGGTPLSSNPSFYNGSIPWLTIEDLNDGIVTRSNKSITELGLKFSSAKTVEPNTLLIAMYGSIGKLGISGIKCATNQAIAYCKVNTEIADLWFVFFYLLYSRTKLLREGRGNTQQNISQTFLKDFPIFLPPITEQKRIAAILQKADRIRQLRRYARQLSDGYLQSVFLEMFGDPANNNETKFSDVVEIDRKQANEQDRSSLPYIGLEDIESNQGILTRDYSLIPREMLATNYIFSANHVLYGKLRPYLNKVFMPTFDGTCSTEILPLLPKEKLIQKSYLASYLMNDRFVEWASRNVEGANLPRLSPERLAEHKIPIPPKETQERFDIIFQKQKNLQRKMSEAERQAEQLFHSLLHQAFEEDYKL